jgi:predicted ATPase
MRLIERESQLAALQEYATEASQGQGRLVLISGEAGVGKSVLLEELAQELDGARWLWAGCDGLFTPAALGPLLDIANQIAGELLRLCRAEAKRDQLYSALLRQLSDQRNLPVVVIEDVHWADEATLDLLSYLGRRIQHLPVLLLVTYGPRMQSQQMVSLVDHPLVMDELISHGLLIKDGDNPRSATR